MNLAPGEFAARVVAWQRAHGRHGLPWQSSREPYAVWLSEVMLQQTQVSTVLAYFERFIARFPNVASLAAAPEEHVMALWSGLGYYSRARNLHRCAQLIMSECGGVFPRQAARLQQLPGIGRSTAAAIAATCFGERSAILDGNVKRVLTRAFAFDADLNRAANEAALWQLAERLLPTDGGHDAMAHYTQGLMDLGATVCLRRSPRCGACPLEDVCLARREGQPERYPVKTRATQRRQRALWLLHAVDPAGRVWLPQRAEQDIWARLRCFPAFDTRDALISALPEAARASVREHEPFQHVLTHRDLQVHVISAGLGEELDPCLASEWIDPAALARVGLPAPVRRFLAAPPQVPPAPAPAPISARRARGGGATSATAG